MWPAPPTLPQAAGRIRGYSDLEVVERALAAGSNLLVEPMTTPESELFAELLRTLGSGEASCVAFARHRGGRGRRDTHPYGRCRILLTRAKDHRPAVNGAQQ